MHKKERQRERESEREYRQARLIKAKYYDH